MFALLEAIDRHDSAASAYCAEEEGRVRDSKSVEFIIFFCFLALLISMSGMELLLLCNCVQLLQDAPAMTEEEQKALVAAFAKRTCPPQQLEAWEHAAIEGHPTSSGAPLATSPPSLVTPTRNPYIDIDALESPEKKTLQPYRKAQLLAQRRLEHQTKLAENKKKQEIEKEAAAEEAKVTEKTGEIKPKKTRPAKTETDADGDEKSTKKSRKAPAGPMQSTMTVWIQKHRQEHGSSHNKAREAWKLSAERRAIVLSLPEPERKKRRFELYDVAQEGN